MKKIIAHTIILAAFFSCNKIKELSAQPSDYTNPVVNRNFPDPTAIKGADGYYYVYGTNGRPNGRFLNIAVARSFDLVSWKMLGNALPVQPDWANKDFWAPHVINNCTPSVISMSAPEVN